MREYPRAIAALLLLNVAAARLPALFSSTDPTEQTTTKGTKNQLRRGGRATSSSLGSRLLQEPCVTQNTVNSTSTSADCLVCLTASLVRAEKAAERARGREVDEGKQKRPRIKKSRQILLETAWRRKSRRIWSEILLVHPADPISPQNRNSPRSGRMGHPFKGTICVPER
jgi:hypothetical protein